MNLDVSVLANLAKPLNIGSDGIEPEDNTDECVVF